ncbi:MAG: transcriptional regulator, partial [Dehalococcoidia bacterium]
AGFSHAGLASRINARSGNLRYDHTAVARWVRDHAIPRGDVPALICDILGERLGRTLAPRDIGMDLTSESRLDEFSPERLAHRATARWSNDSPNHATDEPRLLRGVAALAPIVEWETCFEEALPSHDQGPAVDAGDIEMLRTARDHFELMYRQVGGLAVWPRLVQFLNDHAGPRLRGRYSEEIGKRLHRAAGGLVALAGVCVYDADRHGVAQRYYLDALGMAKTSGDRAFGTYVLALLATQAFLLGEHRQVLRYAEAGLRGDRRDTPAALVADLHTMQAKALAQLRDRRATHQHIKLADSAVSGAIQHGIPEAGYVQGGHLECRHAETLTCLGDLRAARRFAEESLSTAGQAHPRSQVHRLAVLADVLLAEGHDLDLAVDVGAKMLERAWGMESRRIRARLRELRAGMIRSADYQPARELVERINIALAVPL